MRQKFNAIIVSGTLATITLLQSGCATSPENKTQSWIENVNAFMQNSVRANGVDDPLQSARQRIGHAMALDSKTDRLAESIMSTKTPFGKGATGNWVPLGQQKPYTLTTHNEGGEIAAACYKALNHENTFTLSHEELTKLAKDNCFDPLRKLGFTAGTNFDEAEMNRLQKGPGGLDEMS